VTSAAGAEGGGGGAAARMGKRNKSGSDSVARLAGQRMYDVAPHLHAGAGTELFVFVFLSSKFVESGIQYKYRI